MLLKLLESIDDNFDTTTTLEFDISDLLRHTDDAGKASGTLFLDVNVADDLWDFIDDDATFPADQKELLVDSDEEWEKYLKANFDELVSNYYDDLIDKYEEEALEKLYDNWSSYSDEDPYSQYDDDLKGYYDLVADGLGLR